MQVKNTFMQVSEGKLDIAAEGQIVGQAAASPQPQAIFKTGEAAQQVQQLHCCFSTALVRASFSPEVPELVTTPPKGPSG